MGQLSPVWDKFIVTDWGIDGYSIKPTLLIAKPCFIEDVLTEK